MLFFIIKVSETINYISVLDIICIDGDVAEVIVLISRSPVLLDEWKRQKNEIRRLHKKSFLSFQLQNHEIQSPMKACICKIFQNWPPARLYVHKGF